ncbi:protein of unknown function [Stenotrophomonas maltophilia]|nr:protein of unknown function [Stenotrophomonas maltophilia]
MILPRTEINTKKSTYFLSSTNLNNVVLCIEKFCIDFFTEVTHRSDDLKLFDVWNSNVAIPPIVRLDVG